GVAGRAANGAGPQRGQPGRSHPGEGGTRLGSTTGRYPPSGAEARGSPARGARVAWDGVNSVASKRQRWSQRLVTSEDQSERRVLNRRSVESVPAGRAKSAASPSGATRCETLIRAICNSRNAAADTARFVGRLSSVGAAGVATSPR